MAHRSILTVRLQNEHDVVLARQRSRQIASLLGFDSQDQTRLATAVSEIARNAHRYARAGKVAFAIEEDGPPSLLVDVSDAGPGIGDLQAVLDGRYRSTTGMGIGIVGAQRLVDRFEIESSNQGTHVHLRKRLPKGLVVERQRLDEMTRALAHEQPRSAVEEVQAQNQELMRAIEEQQRAMEALHDRQVEVERLNRELQETNRGVMALYAELDEKAEQLRKVSEQKSRFLSYTSHEFRTPLGSIRSIAQLLLDRMDGELAPEQEKQVRFIQASATELANLVDDLLDLAKIEAGRLEVSLSEVAPTNLMAALRGMFRPIMTDTDADLLIDDAEDIPPMRTDDRKVSQILRNLVSNAIKFTPHGQVRVSATYDAPSATVRFAVTDTGIGIPPEKQGLVFDEFGQVDSPLQSQVRGTGLGLPVSRRLAELLGGRLDFTSTPGSGSTFVLTLPLECPSNGRDEDISDGGKQKHEVQHA